MQVRFESRVASGNGGTPLTCLVNHLNIADQVVLLDDRGNVLKSGPPDKVSLPKDYIHRISATRKASITAKEDNHLVQVESALQSQNEAARSQRQVGDFTV